MNRLLLEASELGRRLSPDDRRSLHVTRVLGKRVGDSIEAGVIVEGDLAAFGPAPGAIGSACIEALDGEGLLLSYSPEAEPQPLHPLRLILGFPRPIQGARLLRDLASLGVAEIVLTGTELGEKSYLESDLWKKGEWRRALIEGAEQAGNPRLPRVTREWTLARALAPVCGVMEDPRWAGGGKIVLHPDKDALLFGKGLSSKVEALTLAIGSERGWTERELALFAAHGYLPRSLGPRILKTETAALAAISVALAGLGLM
jgi:RsmE family RNA methyltransferase